MRKLTTALLIGTATLALAGCKKEAPAPEATEAVAAETTEAATEAATAAATAAASDAAKPAAAAGEAGPEATETTDPNGNPIKP